MPRFYFMFGYLLYEWALDLPNEMGAMLFMSVALGATIWGMYGRQHTEV